MSLTSGQWRYHSYVDTIGAPVRCHSVIHECGPTLAVLCCDDAEPVGRLMAAAPALLKLCKRVCVYLTLRYGHDRDVQAGIDEVARRYGHYAAQVYAELRLAITEAEKTP